MTRREIREHIVRLLYCIGFYKSEAETDEQISLYLENSDIQGEEREYILNKVLKIREKQSVIDGLISGSSVGWTIERMSRLDLCIIRLAVYEIRFDDDIPSKVAIDEAVELAKAYGGADSPSFINGILGKIIGPDIQE